MEKKRKKKKKLIFYCLVFSGSQILFQLFSGRFCFCYSGRFCFCYFFAVQCYLGLAIGLVSLVSQVSQLVSLLERIGRRRRGGGGEEEKRRRRRRRRRRRIARGEDKKKITCLVFSFLELISSFSGRFCQLISRFSGTFCQFILPSLLLRFKTTSKKIPCSFVEIKSVKIMYRLYLLVPEQKRRT